MNNLDGIAEDIRAELEEVNMRRDEALKQSRVLIRHCAGTIKAVHRHQWELVEERMAEMRVAADNLRASVVDHPELEHTGYTQDAMKEYAEAMITYAMVRGHDDLPTPQELGVLPSTYLNGLGEAASEMRRQILDLLRDGHDEDVEHLLEVMDTVYTVLFSFDFPDAVSGGLRRRVDQLRAVLERTRGDVTTSMRQQRLMQAMRELEKRFGTE